MKSRQGPLLHSLSLLCSFNVFHVALVDAWQLPRPSYRPLPLRAKEHDTNIDRSASAMHSWLAACGQTIACTLLSASILVQPSSSFAFDASPVDHLKLPQEFATQARKAHDLSERQGTFSIAPSFLLNLQSESPVVDEVWTLVDKYYIDRSFNGQDWDKVKSKYQARAKREDEMKVARDMMKTLGDKYSRMLDVQQYEAIQKYDLIGVGATLMPNQNNLLVVGAPPIANSAADKANLQVGDRVLAVNGVPTKGRTAFDVIDQISDDPNASSVTMTIESDGPEGNRDVTMQRRFQEVRNPVVYKMSEVRADGTKVGFIRLTEFNSLVKPKLEEALASLKADGANALVLDLRMNTGGAFQSAVEIAGLFLDDKVATYVVDGTSAVLPFRTPKDGMAISSDVPLVVWIDGRSASASEVLAASLHDNCRAILMGDKSFGKGLIQAVYGLKNSAGLVLTVAKYVTPNQSEIQGIGITPDLPANNLVPMMLPGVGSDTSKIDFADVKTRLNSFCTVPQDAILPTSSKSSLLE